MRIFFLFTFLVLVSSQSYAGLVTFGPKETKINGSIKYSVIGKYQAHFNAFKGRILVDEKINKIQSVYLEIDTASVESNCSWCDKIVCSDRLLAVAKYPKIIFKSTDIVPNGKDYTAKGILDLHGIKKEISFPFQLKINSKNLDVKGQLMINRKDFNIVWNKVLDHGGVLVGNYIMVEWGIKAAIKNESGN